MFFLLKGYGVVQLCFSFLGSYLMKIANFLGFETDRKTALTALQYTSNSDDIRAPFADMVLVFYSTIGVQLFGYSEIEMFMHSHEVNNLIEKNLSKSVNSCLFYYLKAKYYAILAKDFSKALECFEITRVNAKGVREIESISCYESAILHLANFNYEKAKEFVVPFSQLSNWSKALNGYLCILLDGCLNDLDNFEQKLEIALRNSENRNPIDLFAIRRLEYLNSISKQVTKELFEFLAVELLYLWMWIPYCSEEKLNNVLKGMQVIM